MKELIPPIDAPSGVFVDGNELTGIKGTIVDSKWLNNVQDATRSMQSEILTLLTAAGIDANTEQSNQLMSALNVRYLQSDNALSELKNLDKSAAAVKNLGLEEVAFLDEILHRQGNLYEIFIAGAGAQADSRKNLGLKSAAVCDVGTGTWQIPDMSSQGVTYTAGGGIQYFSNGLMRQWGTSGAIGGSCNSIDITFPVPFPNGIHHARTFDAGNPDASINLCMIGVTSKAGMKIWGVASISAAGPSLAPLNSGKGTLWEAWGN
ncbi:hypothetical protein EKN56_02960 [Limnobaculum zhutongyuii]|uniref:Putative tail fiber protein gp53-like C-terminal domain-containing protein n=1 Tax=Limnobaculum zhutongyuii TaxID=2498113 RepID=A0A411WGT4_9GAMM|nr:hypothetical protein [Limnobaculum zhutongyuii]QBH95455.1 hypothetical protein EKN56_02960 [Limnobaculum zhutongyuii]TQS88856.1 hypothetical protein ELQ32_09635 [Limnobaculum zhutongyuii]